MTKKQIEEHRKKYPLPFKELSKYSSFEQILGKDQNEYILSERQRRWDKAMSKMDKETKEAWEDTSVCHACKHLSEDGWCELHGLPCTVNPVLSFSLGIPGMACMGLGFENKQLELF